MAVAERIVSLVPAERGWRAFYLGEYPEDSASARVIAWALVEEDDGARGVVGLVVADGDPTQIVPAHEGASAVATEFSRYGFKED